MSIYLRFCQENANWGDMLAPYVVGNLTGEHVVPISQHEASHRRHLVAVGSIIDWSTPSSVVWGAGAIAHDAGLHSRPASILAVRGPMTRQVIMNQGMNCPEVFGDPALLLPQIYNPSTTLIGNRDKVPVGIIPHYVDQNSQFISDCRENGVRIIDVFSETTDFIDEVHSCEAILSSSLHGLICADAYGIPSGWLEISSAVRGNGFKFRDYYASIGSSITEPLKPTDIQDLGILGDLCELQSIDLDLSSLQSALLDNLGSIVS